MRSLSLTIPLKSSLQIKEGYTFCGWYSDKELVNEFGFKEKPVLLFLCNIHIFLICHPWIYGSPEVQELFSLFGFISGYLLWKLFLRKSHEAHSI